jgi:hypothetical protein
VSNHSRQNADRRCARRLTYLSLAAVWSGCATPAAPPLSLTDHGLGPSTPRRDAADADLRNLYWDDGQKSIHAAGAVGETVFFQWVLSPGEFGLAGLIVAAEPLKGEAFQIDPSAVRVYRTAAVEITRYPNWYLRSVALRAPRSFPDALIPVSGPGRAAEETGDVGRALSIPPGSELTLFVEILISPAAPPGRYRGALTARVEGRAPHTTPIELEVSDVFLDPSDSLPMVARVHLGPVLAEHTKLDPDNLAVAARDPAARAAIEQTMRLLHENGLSPYLFEIQPVFCQESDGSVALDWGDYDALCAGYIDGSAYPDGRPPFAWPLPINARFPDPDHFDGMESPAYVRVLHDAVTAAWGHFSELGASQRAVLDYGWPTEINPPPKDVQRLCSIIDAARIGPDAPPFLSRLIPQAMRPFGWHEHHDVDLRSQVNIWATPARFDHPATLALLRGEGQRTWLVPDHPPFSGSQAVEAPATHARSIGWQAFLQGHEAVFLRSVTAWPDAPFDEPIDRPNEPSDSWLIYPGAALGVSGPVPSLRLKQLLLGNQEYQYLRLLEVNGRGETARLLARSLLKACGTEAYGDHFADGDLSRRVNDASLWDLARSILIQETAFALTDEPIDSLQRERNLADWSAFLGRTRGIELWVESARLADSPRPDQAGFLATVDVAVRSEMRTSVDGRVVFGPLPGGARDLGRPAKVTALAEWDVASRRLSARLSTLLPTDVFGHGAIPVAFETDASGRADAEAVFSVASVPRASGRIDIDGDLSDWTPGLMNVAGDFRLIAEAPLLARMPAESQTVAYFCHDQVRLFIGIRAASPAGRPPNRTQQNVLRFEDLRPTDADLVEILIDPSGLATRSDDLYHVVIFSTGDPIFERGVLTDPPIGEAGPWTGHRPLYAVRDSADGWTAEIAIDRADFGPESRTRIWGLNVARLEPRRGEYSDWARARRHCYNPRSMGNLIWPP